MIPLCLNAIIKRIKRENGLSGCALHRLLFGCDLISIIGLPDIQ